MLAMRTYILLILAVVLNSALIGQKIPDLSGYWNGTAEVPLSQDIIIEYNFTQRGAILQGYSISKSLDQQDSARAIISGTAKTKSIDIRQTKYIYRTSLGCLSNIKLTYSNENGQEKLVGKWSGSMSRHTCPPGTGGKVELLKVETPIQVVSRTSEQPVIVQPTDVYGTALYKELQNRKYFSLLIGIDSYQDDGIQDLDEPVTDMERSAKFFKQATLLHLKILSFYETQHVMRSLMHLMISQLKLHPRTNF